MSVMTRAAGVVLAVAIGSISIAPLVAQDSGAPSPQKTAGAVTSKPLTPLKVTVVISRWQGDKKTASLPFTVWVNGNGRPTSLRMSESVPVPQNAVMSNNPAQPAPVGVTSYSYRGVGTNIDTTAEALDDNRFSVNLAIEDSQVFSDAKAPGVMAGLPTFQQFNSQMTVILRDGQTAQYTTATDKISGEVIKVDVTLNVIR
jgi:hypothetical protein